MIANSRSTSWWLSAAVGSSKMRTRGLAERQDLRDLDELALRERERADQAVGPDAADADALERFERRAPHRLLVDDEPAGRLRAEREVVGDREVGQEAQLLVDDADAQLVRMGRAADLDRLASELDRAGGRRLVAREDLQERRLAGAVLAEEPVDRAALDLVRSTSSASVPGKRFVICH